MASTLCCIADDRPVSPALPRARRIHISLTEDSLLGGLHSNRNSNFTSTKTEELNDLKKIFGDANICRDGPNHCDGASSTPSNRTARIANFLRRKLSRDKSRSKPGLRTDQRELRKLKQDLRQSLLANHRPESGGYDNDAPVIEDIRDVELAEFGVGRRKTAKCHRRGLQEIEWAVTAPNRYAVSASPISPETPGKGRFLRRSMSEGSLLRGPAATDFRTLRLPSFLTTSDSKGWKFSVMESLCITSPSIANLRAASTSPSQGFRQEVPVASAWTQLERQSITIENEMSSKVEDHISHSPIVDDPQTKIAGPACALTGDAVPCANNMGEGNSLLTAPLVHLYNMRISHHLRSQSAVTSAGPTQLSTSTPITTRQRDETSPSCGVSKRNVRQMSSSGFGSADIPESWGKVIKDETSSIYSSTVETQIAGQMESNIELPEVETDHHSKERAAVDRGADSAAPEDVISTVDEPASQGKPGEVQSEPKTLGLRGTEKTSRFKEEFKTVDSKQAPRHKSLMGLFQSKKISRSCSGALGSMGGPVDEPQRLQRAMALTERQDATGLMASAIKQNRDEKAALLLPGHKDRADIVGVRERSHSFSRPRTYSTAGGSIDAAGPACPLPPPLERRARSAVHLKPEFSTSVFSKSTSNASSEQHPKGRALSIAIDPGLPDPVSMESERSSTTPVWQLNDVSVDITSEPSINALSGTPASAIYHDLREKDLEDSETDFGAWARYPSHTRDSRTGSAGPSDNVKTRDFAYHPSIAAIVESSSEEDTPSGKQKKSKKKPKTRTGMPKSRSMTFAKEFFKNYAKHIRAPNVEFLKYGHGHRSSISTGGKLEYPELEILPPAFAATPISENPDLFGDKTLGYRGSNNGSDIELRVLTPGQSSLARRASLTTRRLSVAPPGVDGPPDNSEILCRQSRRSVSSPSLALSHRPESIYSQNNAQFWSRMYESCVELPRFSVSADHSMSRSRQVSAAEYRYSSEEQDDSLAASMPLLADEALYGFAVSPVTQSNDEICHSPVLNLMELAEHKRQVSVWARTESPISSQSLPARLGHSSRKSICSVGSIRASSMDLWKLLKATEENERLRLMGVTRVSGEADHRF